MAIRAEQKNIGELFRGDQQYQIPDFQRPYVWGPDEAELLVNDLLQAWKLSDPDCFLGSIVVVKQPQGQDVDVIDGQQRLTTLMLLLSVLRQYTADDIQKRELTELLKMPANSIRRVEERPRLKVRSRDRKVFDAYVVEPDIDSLRELAQSQFASESQQNMAINVEAIIEALEEILHDPQAWSFVQFLINEVSIIVVETDGFQSAHRIFGVLNTRGVPLTASDILKAKVLGVVKSESMHDYAQKWDEAVDKIGSNVDLFFQYLLVLITKNESRRALIDEFENKVLTRYFAEHTGEEFIDQILTPAAIVYREIETPGRETVGSLYLNLLGHFPATDWKPVAMRILMLQIPDGKKQQLLKNLERVYGVYYTAGVSPEKRMGQWVTVLRELEDETTLQDDTSPRELLNIPDDIRQRAVLKIRSELPRNALRKVLLYRAALELSDGLPELPRVTAPLQIIPASYLDGIAQNVSLNAWRSRLGGLVLTPIKLKDIVRLTSWAQIVEKLRKDSLLAQLPVCSFPDLDTLTHETLVARQRLLVEAAADYWNIRKDADGVDLTAISESDLLGTIGGRGLAKHRRITIQDIFGAGILEAGDILLWHRANIGDEFKVSVTTSGTLLLADGTEVASPSAAVEQLTGTSAQGWYVFVRERDGKNLNEMRETFEKRFRVGG